MRPLLCIALVACGRIDFDSIPDCWPARLADAPYASSSEGADGTSAATAFLICTEVQLDAIGGDRAHWGSWFRVLRDLDLHGPVPMIGDTTTPFTGTFDGGGHAIAHLTYDLPTTDNVALFSVVGNGAWLGNVTLTGVAITGHDTIGALAGSAQGVTVDTVTVDGRVTGNDILGGVIGEATCNAPDGCSGIVVTKASAQVEIASGGNAGGVIGVASTGRNSPPAQLSQLTSSGTVTGGLAIGGVIGTCSGVAIDASTSSAVIMADSDAGGLVGDCSDARDTITDSSASGTVTCTGYICGGLAGEEATVIRSHATGNVTCGDIYCGGLAANIYYVVAQSYATGDVSGTDQVGGLVGAPDAYDIHDCYATGTVTGRNQVGGLIGWAAGGGFGGVPASSLVRSYSTSRVHGADQVGGLVGRVGATNESWTVTDSFAVGNVGGTSPGGLVSALIGTTFASVTTSGMYFDATATCSNTMGGCATVGTAAPGASYFYASTNAPLVRWDFATVWQELPMTFPGLR